MMLSDLQLECMKLGADKTLSFGCVILVLSNGQVDTFSGGYHDQYNKKEEQYFYYIDEDLVFSNRNGVEDMCRDPRIRGIGPVDVDSQKAEIVDIIGHPITRSRLCYLNSSQAFDRMCELRDNFKNNSELYNQTILERDEETVRLVLLFLQSLNGHTTID